MGKPPSPQKAERLRRRALGVAATRRLGLDYGTQPSKSLEASLPTIQDKAGRKQIATGVLNCSHPKQTSVDTWLAVGGLTIGGPPHPTLGREQLDCPKSARSMPTALLANAGMYRRLELLSEAHGLLGARPAEAALEATTGSLPRDACPCVDHGL